jgi:hypothetical protein
MGKSQNAQHYFILLYFIFPVIFLVILARAGEAVPFFFQFFKILNVFWAVIPTHYRKNKKIKSTQVFMLDNAL